MNTPKMEAAFRMCDQADPSAGSVGSESTALVSIISVYDALLDGQRVAEAVGHRDAARVDAVGMRCAGHL